MADPLAISNFHNIINYPKPVHFMDIRFPQDHCDDYRREPRPFGSFAYVDSGSAVYETEEGSFAIGPGEILAFSAGTTYISRWGHEAPHILGLHFSTENEWLHDYHYPVQKIRASPETVDSFRYIIGHYTAQEEVYRVLEQFYRICGFVFPKLRMVKKPPIDGRIRSAVQYINAHYTEQITINTLCSVCHLSGSYFFRCFRESMGLSPIEYKQRIMMMNAQRMLLIAPDIPIGEIAESLGFTSETYFRRVFRSVTGCSPRDYRNNGGII